jgi:hypothetical protein
VVEQLETKEVVNFQLWEANDYDLGASKKIAQYY